jgi:hypothetical protein
MIRLIQNPLFCLFICQSTVFHSSPKELHFRRYSLPDHADTIVPSGMNDDAEYYMNAMVHLPEYYY